VGALNLQDVIIAGHETVDVEFEREKSQL